MADLQRPVADASEPDIEAQLAAGLAQRAGLNMAGQPLDLSAVLETEVTRQRLRDSLASSAAFNGWGGEQPGDGAAAAAAGAGEHTMGAASSSSSSVAAGVGAAVATAAAGGHSHQQQQHASSSSSGGQRPQPGHASRQQPGPSDQVRAPPTSSSSSSSHHAGGADERTPLLHARRPQHTQQPGGATPSSSSSAAVQPPAPQAAGPEGEAGDKGPKLRGGIPHSIFVLSMVSMALTSASCVFNTLLPIYMVTELKMTMRSMGMFEGEGGQGGQGGVREGALSTCYQSACSSKIRFKCRLPSAVAAPTATGPSSQNQLLGMLVQGPDVAPCWSVLPQPVQLCNLFLMYPEHTSVPPPPHTHTRHAGGLFLRGAHVQRCAVRPHGLPQGRHHCRVHHGRSRQAGHDLCHRRACAVPGQGGGPAGEWRAGGPPGRTHRGPVPCGQQVGAGQMR